MDVIDHLRIYVSVQRGLIFALCELDGVEETPGLTGVPWLGSLAHNDSFWEFQKHGAGVSFSKTSTGTVIDAHIEMFDAPDAFDAWRLVQYFESSCVESVGYQNELFDVTNERKVEDLLDRLHRDGKLSTLNRGNLYHLSE
jgi:hypothetical protein